MISPINKSPSSVTNQNPDRKSSSEKKEVGVTTNQETSSVVTLGRHKINTDFFYTAKDLTPAPIQFDDTTLDANILDHYSKEQYERSLNFWTQDANRKFDTVLKLDGKIIGGIEAGTSSPIFSMSQYNYAAGQRPEAGITPSKEAMIANLKTRYGSRLTVERLAPGNEKIKGDLDDEMFGGTNYKQRIQDTSKALLQEISSFLRQNGLEDWTIDYTGIGSP